MFTPNDDWIRALVHLEDCQSWFSPSAPVSECKICSRWLYTKQPRWQEPNYIFKVINSESRNLIKAVCGPRAPQWRLNDWLSGWTNVEFSVVLKSMSCRRRYPTVIWITTGVNKLKQYGAQKIVLPKWRQARALFFLCISNYEFMYLKLNSMSGILIIKLFF